MLITYDTVIQELKKANIYPKGVIHIGAHDCEEIPFYQLMGIANENVVWIDAIQDKVDQATVKGIPNVFKAVITDKDNDTVTFHLTNNVQSSSILEFGTHAHHHPWVHFVGSVQETTTSLDTFLKNKQLDPSNFNFWNLDIQGAELLALKGGSQALQYAQALYMEVNSEEVYKGCAKMEELDAFLVGFKRVLTHMTEYGWGDALYVRS